MSGFTDKEFDELFFGLSELTGPHLYKHKQHHIEKENTLKWDNRFLNLAKEVSTWSKDPSTQIGAIAVDSERRILATGYNGFPKNIEDTELRLNDRATKYQYIVHGEMNCIYNATLNGVSLKDSTLYVYGLPVCSECAKGVIQVGIKRVVALQCTEISDKWKESDKLSKNMFDEVGVEHSTIYNVPFIASQKPLEAL